MRTSILWILFLCGCGTGFAIDAQKATQYTGDAGSYCSLPASYSQFPVNESLPSASSLPTLRSTAQSLVNQNRLQEAIWLYQDDPQGAQTASDLKQQLYSILSTQSYTVENSNLGGAYEKYILDFQNGIKAVFKPTNDVYPEYTAYQLDQLGQFGIVPMVVVRTVNGRQGTVQYFLNGMSAGDVSQISSTNFRRMVIFDYLMRNRDRDTSNFLYWSDLNRVVAIDNGASFFRSCGIPDEIKKHLAIEKTLAQRLFSLSAKEFSNALGSTPFDKQMLIWYELGRIRN